MTYGYPSEDVDWLLGKLEPLKRGYPVVLSMQDAKYQNRKNYRGKRADQIVALAPGELYGMTPRSILVSVIGNGACVVHPATSEKIADLVLAGMPARLANVLMGKLHQLLKE